MSSSIKEAVILVIISFLAVALIFSSFSSYVFARSKITYGPVECTPKGGQYSYTPLWVECCQKQTDSSGLEITYCTWCDNTQPPSNCGPRFTKQEANPATPEDGRLPSNALLPPSSTPTIANNNTTSTPPTLSITKEHNPASPKIFNPPPSQQQQTTTTCPDGSTPDENGKCPSSNTTTEQHHNKESNLVGNAGELAGSKKGNKDNSPTPPPCPTDNSPIPPNCTLKPKF